MSGAFPDRGAADAVRRRPVHEAVAGSDREPRARQLQFVNPDGGRRDVGANLARGGIGAQRGVQFSARRMEARDAAAAARAGAGAAARKTRRADPARMGRTAPGAAAALYAGAVARRSRGDVLRPGEARARRGCAGRVDGAQMRAGAVAAEHRGARGIFGFAAAAAARGGTRKGTPRDRAFRVDLSRQAAERAAQYRRDTEAPG